MDQSVIDMLDKLPEYIRGGKLGVSMDQKLNIKKYGGYYYIMYSRDGWKGTPKVQVSDKSILNALEKITTWLQDNNISLKN